jgi:CBS domain-containing protein
VTSYRDLAPPWLAPPVGSGQVMVVFEGRPINVGGPTMLARDLAGPFPSIRRDAPAIEAARLLAGQDLPGLIVLDGRNHPFTVLPGPDVLRMAIPQYCLDDPTLARVIDEAAADLVLRELGDRTVAQCLPTPLRELPVVGPEATVLEVAALMARSRSPLVVVASPGAPMLGVITLDALLDRVLAA